MQIAYKILRSLEDKAKSENHQAAAVITAAWWFVSAGAQAAAGNVDPLIQAIREQGKKVSSQTAMEGQKTTTDGVAGRVYHGEILDTVRSHLNEVSEMPTVAYLTGSEFQKQSGDTRTLRSKVMEFFNSLGNKVTRADIGDIALTDAGARDSTAHGYGKLKAATFAALPSVLKDGKIIRVRGPYDGHSYDSIFISAPVNVDGTTHYVGALVIKDANTQRYKLHEVLTVNESGAPLFKSESTGNADGPLRSDTPLGTSGDVPTKISIPQTAPDVNTETGKDMAAPAAQPVDPLIADIRSRGVTGKSGTQTAVEGLEMPSTGIATETQKAATEQVNIVDSAAPQPYNKTSMKGGLSDGADGTQLDGASGEGVREELSGYYQGETSRRLPGQGDLRTSGCLGLSDQSKQILQQRGVVTVDMEMSADKAAFSRLLDEARTTDIQNGWAVTPKTAEELVECRTFISADGGVGFAIAPDGDIEAVFRNRGRHQAGQAMKSAIPQAVAAGGTKLDCYGSGLVQVYAHNGFVPVARVAFNPEFANPSWTVDKGTPDIYVMMATDTDPDIIVQKQGSYHYWTDAELAALPLMEYDDAMSYRDRLLAEQLSSKGGLPGMGGGAPNSVGAAAEGQMATQPIDPLIADIRARGVTGKSGTQTAIERQSTTSTAIDTDPATHTPEQMAMIKEYQDAVDDGLAQFYDAAKDGGDMPPYMMKPVSERVAVEIKNILGKEVSGFSTVFEPRIAKHIDRDHGEHGKADHSMRDTMDVARMQFVLDNFDMAVDGGTTDAYWETDENGKNRKARTIVFSKKVNGTYYVVEAAPITKAKSTYIVSAYMSKAGTSHPADASAPAFTAKTENVNVPASNSIPQTAQKVKPETGIPQAASQPVDPLIADIRAKGQGTKKLHRRV